MNWQQWAMFGLGAWLGAAIGYVTCALMVANKQGDEVTRSIACHTAQQQEREAFRRHLAGEREKRLIEQDVAKVGIAFDDALRLMGSEGENLPRATEAECAMSMRGRGVR